jgi:hypothetical protein
MDETMKIEITGSGDDAVAEIISDGVVIRSVDDALDLMANCSYQGAMKMIIREEHLLPEFFDLKTGIAGEILQKFSNYRTQLAIVGDFSKYTSKSLRDFIYESNKGGRIFFGSSVEEAKAKLKEN